MDAKAIQAFISKLKHLLESEDNNLRGFLDTGFADFSARDITDITLHVSVSHYGYIINSEDVGKVEIQEFSVLDKERLEGTCIRSKPDWGKAAADLFVIVAAIDDGVILRLAKDPCSTLQLVSYKALKDFYVAQDGHTLGTAVAVDYEDMLPVAPKT